MFKKMYSLLFGEDKFLDVDYFRYDISPYLLDDNRKKRLMFISLSGSIR